MELARCAVTQNGPHAAGQHSGYAAPEVADAPVADRIDAAVDVVEPTTLKLSLDRADAEAKPDQLPPTDHTVLPRDEFAHHPPD